MNRMTIEYETPKPSTKKAVIGGAIYIDGTFQEGYFVGYDKDILAVEPVSAFRREEYDEIVTLTDELLVPGFIDIHIHGCAGCDAMDATPEALKTIAEALPRYGVTSFLPTTMTMPPEQIEKALRNIREFTEPYPSPCNTFQNSRRNETASCGGEERHPPEKKDFAKENYKEQSGEERSMKDEYCENRIRGARVLGAHLEGPFISPRFKGAQSAEHIAAPDSELMRRLIEEYRDTIKIVTIAPEAPGATRMIETFSPGTSRSSGIRFSLGHSEASYEEANRAFASGASSVTHLFNAMSPLHHREPGLVGAALLSDVYAELICDDIHIRPEIYRLVWKCKGSDRILLISDGIRAGGMEDGVFDLGGQTVHVCSGKCALEDGTIAGSVLHMSQALKNMVRHAGIPLSEAVKMTSCNQADYLGLGELGRIARGCRADFALLSSDLDVLRTIRDGESIFQTQERHPGLQLLTNI